MFWNYSSSHFLDHEPISQPTKKKLAPHSRIALIGKLDSSSKTICVGTTNEDAIMKIKIKNGLYNGESTTEKKLLSNFSFIFSPFCNMGKYKNELYIAKHDTHNQDLIHAYLCYDHIHKPLFFYLTWFYTFVFEMIFKTFYMCYCFFW